MDSAEMSAAVAIRQDSGLRRGWLFTVAKRIVIDQWRAAGRRPEHQQLVLTALRTLSVEHRQVLFECYFRDASIAEAAETLGLPAGTVKSRIHYALKALGQAVGTAR